MADGVNLCTFIGNLGQDAELRYTANGNSVANFSMAVSRSFQREGKREEETTWVPVVVWGKPAEFVGQYATKGRKVYVQGRLTTRSWEKDGQKHYRTEIVADNVVLLDRAPTAAGVAGGGDIDPDDLPFVWDD